MAEGHDLSSEIDFSEGGEGMPEQPEHDPFDDAHNDGNNDGNNDNNNDQDHGQDDGPQGDADGEGEAGAEGAPLPRNVLFVTRFRQSAASKPRFLEVFSPFGRVLDVKILHKSAFVEFESEQDAERAKQELDRQPMLDSDALIVDFRKNSPKGRNDRRRDFDRNYNGRDRERNYGGRFVERVADRERERERPRERGDSRGRERAFSRDMTRDVPRDSRDVRAAGPPMAGGRDSRERERGPPVSMPVRADSRERQRGFVGLREREGAMDGRPRYVRSPPRERERERERDLRGGPPVPMERERVFVRDREREFGGVPFAPTHAHGMRDMRDYVPREGAARFVERDYVPPPMMRDEFIPQRERDYRGVSRDRPRERERERVREREIPPQFMPPDMYHGGPVPVPMRGDVREREAFVDRGRDRDRERGRDSRARQLRGPPHVSGGGYGRDMGMPVRGGPVPMDAPPMGYAHGGEGRGRERDAINGRGYPPRDVDEFSPSKRQRF